MIENGIFAGVTPNTAHRHSDAEQPARAHVSSGVRYARYVLWQNWLPQISLHQEFCKLNISPVVF